MLPTPNLDDRRFQDLVDDAKRLVQQRCPEWTDHNVSDPGVTLIELFAWMTDLLLYRLNRVPDRNYVKFLELIGVHLFPPVAARTSVTFWLSAPQPGTIAVPTGTSVATPRTETEEGVTFTTVRDLDIVPCEFSAAVTVGGEGTDGGGPGKAVERTGEIGQLGAETGFPCFGDVPTPGDTFLIGLDTAAPSCAVVIRLACRIEGVGVDPRNPPLVWEAWDGEGWSECDLEVDETGGLNRNGDVILHLPDDHTVSVVARQRAGWVRCRVLAPEEGQPAYSASPRIESIAAFSIGGTAPVTHAEVILGEVVGLSEGVPGQHFALTRPPVVAGEEAIVLEVASGDGWAEWSAVESFTDSGPTDRHFLLDETTGELRFGPAVRQPDGSVLQYGSVPAKGAPLRLRAYRTGGGSAGNVSSRSATVLRSSIPFIDRVENRSPATGGVDAEELDNAKQRAPVLLRTRNRAVTVEDYETLAREACPAAARVRAVGASTPEEAGGVRVLVVPTVTDERGRLAFESLIPADTMLATIAEFLDSRRVVGARIVVEPPEYQAITVVARVRARPRANPGRLREDALAALYGYFHPVTGGPDGHGWPFGRPVHVGEVYAVLQQLPDVELVEDARLFAADPVTGERGEQATRIELGPHALVFSYEHQVLAQGA